MVDDYEDWISPSYPKPKTVCLPILLGQNSYTLTEILLLAVLIPLHLWYVAFYRFQDLLYDLVLFLVGVPYRKRLIGHSLRSGSCVNLYFVVLRFCVRLVSEDGGRVSFSACESLRNLGGEIQDAILE